jgi:hypothetical protein
MSQDDDLGLPDDFMDQLHVTDEPVPRESVIPRLAPAEEIVWLDPRDP